MDDYSLREDGILIGKLGRGLKVTIPQSICDLVGLREGDDIGLMCSSDSVNILPQSTIEQLVQTRARKDESMRGFSEQP
jgi:antitoxin component of MazEF toxin-antitoxin module